MNNDLGLAWEKMLKQFDVKKIQWLIDNNVFNRNDNKYLQKMNEMLLARLDKVKIDI